jgi:rhodanese-related sulfurtransferase
MTLVILSIILIIYSLYKRYFPVCGVPNYTLTDIELDVIKVIDVRDFNESYKNPIKGAVNIPLAYLKRNLNEIPDRKVHVIGSNKIDKNVAIRFLRQKGFHVKGYTIMN